MFCNIKNLKLNNILYYFLLILIILAGVVLIKKYTKVYEGMTASESMNNLLSRQAEYYEKKVEKETEILSELNNDAYNRKIKSMNTLFDLSIKKKVITMLPSNIDKTFADIKSILNKKEVLNKISENGSMSYMSSMGSMGSMGSMDDMTSSMKDKFGGVSSSMSDKLGGIFG